MKILYLSSVRIPSEKASGLAIVRQCNAFSSLGHEVTICAPKRRDSTQTDISTYYGEDQKFKIKYFNSPQLFRFGLTGFGITRFWDMLHAFIYVFKNRKYTNFLYTRDQWLLALPLLFNVVKTSIVEIHTKHTDFVTKFVVRRATKVIVISAGLKKYYQEFSGQDDIQVEPSGVDVEQFKINMSQAEIRRELGLPIEKCLFSYVGKYQTMGEEKGVDDIVRAFAQASKKDKTIHLQIVGVEPNEMPILEELALKEGLSKNGFSLKQLDQSRFAKYLLASDVLLMNYPNTEHYANYMSPTKLFAYLASGKPIISSDLESIRGVADECIIFTPAGDVVSYAESILYAKSNLNSLKELEKVRVERAGEYVWSERASSILYS